MKKEYKTPYLLMESFQLNAAVAGSCNDAGKVVLNHSANECTLTDYNLEYFGLYCDVDLVNWSGGGDDDDTFCYHGPISADENFLVS